LPLPDLLDALGRSNEEEVAGLLAAARAEAETIRAGARAEADERLGRTLDAERLRLRRDLERRRVAARREATAKLLRARAALLDRVFEAASARAPRVRAWPEYEVALRALVQRLRQLLGDAPAVLRCPPDDVDFVRGFAAGSGLSVVPDPEIPAGVCCTAEAERLTVDLTVPTRLAVERGALSIAIGPELEAGG